MSAPEFQHQEPLRELDFLFSEQRRLARAGWTYLVTYIVVTSAIYVILDLYAYEQHSLYGLVGVISWAFGYVVFLSLMRVGGYLKNGQQTGIGTFFALGIAIGIPAVLALFVLIVPGVYLVMRWLPAYSRALVTTDGIGNAMRWSWDNTGSAQKPLAIAIIAPLSGYAVSFGMIYFYEFHHDEFTWSTYVAASIVWNVAMSVGIAWLTVFGIAAYGLVANRDHEAAEAV